MPFDAQVLIVILLILVGLIILYYVLLIRAILQMLRREANTVLMVFAFIALIFSPFTLIMGIAVLIIWKIHKKHVPE